MTKPSTTTQETWELEPSLLPCPFCGEKAAWGEGEQKSKYGNEQVYCSSCYAMTAPEGSKEEAAWLWNDRNDLVSVLTDEVTRLREYVHRHAQDSHAAFHIGGISGGPTFENCPESSCVDARATLQAKAEGEQGK